MYAIIKRREENKSNAMEVDAVNKGKGGQHQVSRDGPGFKHAARKQMGMSGSMMRSNGRKRTQGGLRKFRKEKEKEKEDPSRVVVTIVANGDIQLGTVHRKEKDSKGSATCAECRDTRPNTVRRAAEKGRQKGKAKPR